MAAVLHGKVDQIILTGGHCLQPLHRQDPDRVPRLDRPVTTYPGEDELLALCQGAPAS